ncbi:hypothetical protein GN956_G6965 [Arapaima gigas]
MTSLPAFAFECAEDDVPEVTLTVSAGRMLQQRAADVWKELNRAEHVRATLIHIEMKQQLPTASESHFQVQTRRR